MRFPFDVDPGWYDRYWYSARAPAKRRSFSGNVARFAVLAALLAGSGVALSKIHVHKDTSSLLQDWAQE